MWSNLPAQRAALGPRYHVVEAPPFRMAREWRDQGWLRQIKVYRLRRQCKGWQVAPWWRFPPGRWPAPPRELIAWAQRQAASNEQHPCHTTTALRLAVSFLLCPYPTQMALYCLELSEDLETQVVPILQESLRTFHAILEAEEPFHPQLTPGDLRIAQMLLEGIGQSEVAARLGLSESTVRSRIAVLCRRYGVPNRRALLACLFKTIGSDQQGLKRSLRSFPAQQE
ncbi:helix-turn-helix transcriptional regulator [Acidithiobacillus sulfuriphilus]|uniref:helix-turn-helix transcriptional regulator n=1 Tax=Acidithiobacillus sulfuriphilus TaxID=1867749 RepID=UPI003F5D7470